MIVITIPTKLSPESKHRIAIMTGVKKLQKGTIQLMIMLYVTNTRTKPCRHLDAIIQLERPRIKPINTMYRGPITKEMI
eukprot:XP_001708819.1 Hypothetical protein GL50803_39477 [Giardia lamblia ATCC 50803]